MYLCSAPSSTDPITMKYELYVDEVSRVSSDTNDTIEKEFNEPSKAWGYAEIALVQENYKKVCVKILRACALETPQLEVSYGPAQP